MPPISGWEEGLRKIMQKVGHAVEWSITRGRTVGDRARQLVREKTQPGVQPILSMEGQLRFAKLREIMAASSERLLSGMTLNLVDRAVAAIGDTVPTLYRRFREAGAGTVIGVEIGELSPFGAAALEEGILRVRADIAKLPFSANHLDWVFFNLATPSPGNAMHALGEMGRILRRAGEGFFIDFHPFGHYARRGKGRLKQVESPIQGISDYYKIGRGAGLTVTDVREIFVDDTLRDFFVTPEEQKAYRNLKGSPLIVGVMLRKTELKSNS